VFRRAPTGAVDDEQLLPEQQRFGGDGTGAAWTEKLCEGDEQMND